MTTAGARGLEAKSLDHPDETRLVADKGRIELVTLGGVTVGRATFEPGWRWSEHVKPLAGTPSCQAAHVGYVLAGRLHIKMGDGTEREVGPGEAMVCGPGHDAWTVGDEPCIALDFSGMEEYAKPR
jgi:quercetin dioxygenase-like cupin family protein